MSDYMTFRELYRENEKDIKRLKRFRWFAMFMVVFCVGIAVIDLYVGKLMWAAVQAVLAMVNLYLVYRDTKTLQEAYKIREKIWIGGNRWGWDV